MRFVDKHVLISGAARGIGYEIAKHFGREGAMLSLLDYHSDNLEAVSTELPQLFTTETEGAGGMVLGAATPVPGALVHPFTDWVTV